MAGIFALSDFEEENLMQGGKVLSYTIVKRWMCCMRLTSNAHQAVTRSSTDDQRNSR